MSFAGKDSASVSMGFVVFVMPFEASQECLAPKTRGATSPSPIVAPVLAVRTQAGGIEIPPEAVAWSLHLRRSRSLEQTRSRVRAIGRLYEYYQMESDLDLDSSRDVDMLVSNFLALRLETPKDPGAREIPHWRPVSFSTVRDEFRAIASFAAFCRRHETVTSQLGAAFRRDKECSWQKAVVPSNRRDILSHLQLRRQRMNELLGTGPVTSPVLLDHARKHATAVGQHTANLAVDEVEALIRSEPNPAFKAMWIMLAYLGPRISEALHLWRCDVLPGSYSSKVSRIDMTGLPFVVFAHPSDSPYLGSFDLRSRNHDRRTELQRRYGLNVRMEPDEPGQASGWKGVLLANSDWKLSWGYWTDPRKAHQFAELWDIIATIHDEAGLDGRHPYFFVNIRNAQYFGEPMQIGNVETALERAFRRIGIEPHSPGANLHGLRHFYAWYARKLLKLPEDVIQMMMRHRSQKSQLDYGKRAEDAYITLSEAFR
jgi:hypothetical protein